MAWGNAKSAVAFDALSLLWSFNLAYVFPPIRLIPRVMEKLCKAVGVYLLITPLGGSGVVPQRGLSVHCLPYLANLVVDLTTSSPLSSSHRLEDNRRAHNLEPLASSAVVGVSLLMTDMSGHVMPSHNFCNPTMFQSISSLKRMW